MYPQVTPDIYFLASHPALHGFCFTSSKGAQVNDCGGAIFETIVQQRLLMSRKVDIAERNPTVFFSPELFQCGADKEPGSQRRPPATFIAGRSGPQIQEWADHPKETCTQNVSVANASYAFGTLK